VNGGIDRLLVRREGAEATTAMDDVVSVENQRQHVGIARRISFF